MGGRADGYTEGKYGKRRSEIWGLMRGWLTSAAVLPREEPPRMEETLKTELSGPTYDFSLKGDAIMLESKKDMRRRGIASPNVADALACTFAFPAFVPTALGGEPE